MNQKDAKIIRVGSRVRIISGGLQIEKMKDLLRDG